MLSTYLAFAIETARAAGEILLEGMHKPLQTSEKSAQTDIVTEIDRAAEALIVNRIQQTFPEHDILGEEGGAYGNNVQAMRWVIDPMDGTTNFASRIPHFSVSIALCKEDGMPVVGVVYDPNRDECFAASKGHGARLNDRPITVSTTATLAASVVASGFPYDKWTDSHNNVDLWGQFVVRSRGIRRMGSAALDLAYVACGRFDGYWEHKLNPWDLMGGLLLVTEAGGQVTDYLGRQEGLLEDKPNVVATNRRIHDQMLRVIQNGDNVPRPL